MTVLILSQRTMLQFDVLPKARRDSTFEVRVIPVDDMEALCCKDDIPKEPPKKKKEGA
jgi:hypothetical protein